MSAGRSEIEAFVKSTSWYQTFEIASGISTPGGYNCLAATVKYGWPARMDGWIFLDIGSNGGFYVVEAHRRGAARAVGIDREADQIDKARRVAHYMAASVEFVRLDMYDLKRLQTGFDWIQMLNVFHHFRRPWDALRIVWDVLRPGGWFLWEGITGDASPRAQKKFACVERLPEVMPPHAYAPSTRGWVAMLREIGFTAIECRGLNRWDRLIYKCRRPA